MLQRGSGFEDGRGPGVAVSTSPFTDASANDTREEVGDVESPDDASQGVLVSRRAFPSAPLHQSRRKRLRHLAHLLRSRIEITRRSLMISRHILPKDPLRPSRRLLTMRALLRSRGAQEIDHPRKNRTQTRNLGKARSRRGHLPIYHLLSLPLVNWEMRLNPL